MSLETLDDYLVGIVLGVRFRPNFSIEDQLGKITDDILFSKDALFSPDKFPMVQHGLNEKALVNEETGDRLNINNSNIVLQVHMPGSFGPADVPKVIQAFDRQVIKGLMHRYAIRDIARVGLVRRFVIDLEGLANTFVDKTIGKTLEGVNDINLRFSKKLPIDIALIKREVNDYYNVIFNIIKKAYEQEIYISIDFQQYFVPPLNASSEMQFEKFVSEAEKFALKRCLPWLRENYIEAKAS
ncbi:MAG TPA: hypothetical protein VMS71_00485 [Candidatus Acidoferrum sp.]|nr:hypothetical protein [Candidatus Acidoferrum sp.]